jgi:hypothetical protein
MNARWHAHYKSQIVAATQEVERLNGVVNRLFGEKDDIDDDLQNAKEKLGGLMFEYVSLQKENERLELLAHPEKEVVTLDEYNVMKESKCANCGGIHVIACPRVKRIRFAPGGQTPVEVEFWADNEWPKENVKWIENLEVEGLSNG